MTAQKRTIINLTPSNSQTLNPSLFHKVKLLNSNIVDVISAINEILETNPFIEIEYEEPIEEIETDKKDNDEMENNEDIDITADDFDISLIEDFFERDEEPLYLSRKKERVDNLMEKIIMAEDSTKDRIKKLVRADMESQVELLIAEYIIDNLNEKGFLELTKDEIEDFLGEIKIEENESPDFEFFEKIRNKILSIKPFGIGAYDTKESLIVQADKRDLKHKEIIKKIIEEDLEEFAKDDTGVLLEKYNLSEQELDEIKEEIKLLTPFPADMISVIKPEYIIPDVVITKGDDNYEIYLNDENYPKPRLSNYYRKIIEQMKWQRNKDAKFIRAKFEEAVNFIKSLDYRNSSLYRVTKAIIDIQKEFFEKGTEFIKPLNLKAISELTGIHESAISRIVSNKYVLTPKGVFKLKFFFSTSFHKVGGGEISSKSIKEKIKRIINNESPEKPITDQEIAELLSKDGINIKRRTVAKYRDLMEIPSSKKRKHLKKNKEVRI